MSSPSPITFFSGVGAVSADSLNSFIQIALNPAQLRTFTGLSNSVALVLGTTATNDGGQGLYFYNSTGAFVDNGASVIVPYGALNGAWLNLALLGGPFPTTNPVPGSGIVWNNGGFLCVA